jgi:indolepyruvate ferredoxin oxidoreductase alpha subunit
MSAMGDPTAALPIADFVRKLEIPLTVGDPYDVHGTVAAILKLLERGGLQVLLLQRACSLQALKGGGRNRVHVDPERCRGDACGCSRLCSRVFACPANIWDEAAGRATIDEVLCAGCGVCAALCPQGAIVVEPREGAQDAAP